MNFYLRALGWLLLAAFVFPCSPFVARALADEPPTITVPPKSLSLPAGSSAVFTVSATGLAPLTYQWYRGESGDCTAPISSATGPMLVTPALIATTRVWVRVTSASAAASSPAATITVIVPEPSLAMGAMGNNDLGQLGGGASSSHSAPTTITTNVASVSAGAWHTLFVKTDSSLWAMGHNYNGQLGSGTFQHTGSLPVQIATDVASASAGTWHTLFVKTDGSLWAMGYNSHGQLGDGSSNDRATPVQIATGVASVSAGAYHTLFVKTDGSLWAMGYNSYGQLGDGSFGYNNDRTTPVQVATSVVSVSAGSFHTLFVKADGSLWAMGDNSYGRLGDGSFGYNVNRPTPVQVSTGVVSVSAGDLHTVFVKTDGSLWAMGYNGSGQLGDGATTNRATPVQASTSVVSVSAGGHHTLFVKTDGSLWAMGHNGSGQLGDGSTTARITPVQVATNVTSVSSGGYHTLFFGTSHTVTFALGARGTRTGGGALEQPVIGGTAALAPTVTANDGWAFRDWDVPFASVTADLVVTAQYVVPTLSILSTPPISREVGWQGSTSLAVTASANAPLTYQWYRGESGDTTSPVAGVIGPLFVTPPLTSTTRFWVRVANSGLSVDIPTTTVTVIAPVQPLILSGMGKNDFGQLGDDAADRATPVLIKTGVTSVSAGSSHTLFVKTSGSLWAMGYNEYGQLGDDSFDYPANQYSPVFVATGVASVSSGDRHTLFIKTDRSLWGMGYNMSGSRPTQVAIDVASVSAGHSHTLFVKTDGTLWAMGDNSYGQLGSDADSSRPIQCATGVVAVSVGSAHSLFVKTDGALWAMGDNSDGQLGDGSTTARSTPVQITTGVVSVSAGASHTLFVKTDGSLWAMGNNDYGQLGDGFSGSLAGRASPVQIATGVASVSAGTSHTLFVKSDGSLWAMGNNDYGQLGDGSTIARSRPVQIATGVTSVSAGGGHTLFLSISPTVTFALGTHATRTGGGNLVQTVPSGTAVTAPTLSVAPGWVFTGWDVSFASVTTDLVVTAQYQTALAAWSTSFALTGPAAAPLADPDADGTPNLLEYAFGLSPTAANPASASPSVTSGLVGDQPALVYSHRRRKGTALTYVYERSSNLADLAAWTPVTVTPVVTDMDADATGLVETVSVSVPLPGGANPQLFLRLSVSE